VTVVLDESHLTEYADCFGCGGSNPIGLRLKFQMRDECLVAEFVSKSEHQGWPGIVHGGIITALLYEIMENFPYHQDILTMTKTLQTRFRRPAKTGQRIIVKSWLVNRAGRKMDVAATLTGLEGELIAEGSCILVVLDPKQAERLGLA